MLKYQKLLLYNLLSTTTALGVGVPAQDCFAMSSQLLYPWGVSSGEFSA